MSLTEKEEQTIANLSYYLYYRDDKGKILPDHSYSDGEGRHTFPQEIKDQYETTILHEDNGDFIYGFMDWETGDLYVGARGTDNIFEDGWQYPLIAPGVPTPLTEELTKQVHIYSDLKGGQPVYVFGHLSLPLRTVP